MIREELPPRLRIQINCDTSKKADYSQDTHLAISFNAALIMRIDYEVLSGKHEPRRLALISSIAREQHVPMSVAIYSPG